MTSHHYPTRRSPAERNAHVLRTIRDCAYLAAARLAAEERNEAWIARVELERLAREAGLPPTGFEAHLASFRESVGASLIRMGEWLRGRSADESVANAAPGA
jgi:hypothetical protein